MLELPEVLTIAGQLDKAVVGNKVNRILPPTKAHKFCWYHGDPAEYDAAVAGKRITGAEGFGMYVEIILEGGMKLCFNDGVNVRVMPIVKAPQTHQLMIELENETALVFTVAMYGGIFLHDGSYDNEYYQKSKQAVSVFSPEFETHFQAVRRESKPTLSAKAFLATEQRFPGIGSGVLQDILFEAGIPPKRKVGTFTEKEWSCLLRAMSSVLRKMWEMGGRDTEKDLFGNPGGYQTKMSKITYRSGCPICGGPITKEAYLGGSVYYCPACQPN